MDMDGIENRLYGGSPKPVAAVVPTAAPPAAPSATSAQQQQQETAQTDEPRTQEAIADGLYGEREEGLTVEVPEAIQKLRADDRERRMYPAQKTLAGIPTEQWFARAEVDDSIKAVAAREMREIFCDLGASVTDATELHSAVASITEVPTAETMQAWQQEAAQALVQRYGKDADSMLETARALVARDPRVAKMLQGGLGNHPRIVLKFVELAQRERRRGCI